MRNTKYNKETFFGFRLTTKLLLRELCNIAKNLTVIYSISCREGLFCACSGRQRNSFNLWSAVFSNLLFHNWKPPCGYILSHYSNTNDSILYRNVSACFNPSFTVNNKEIFSFVTFKASDNTLVHEEEENENCLEKDVSNGENA